MKQTGFGLLIMLMILSLVSCSGSSEPVTPGSSLADSPVNELPLIVSDVNADGSATGGTGTFGVFSVHVNTETLNYEMTSLRNTASKDSIEVLDVTNFMTSWPCKDCATLNQVGFTAWGDLNMVFGVKHPFPTPNLNGEITGRNRADLHLFNVEGMLVFADQAKNFGGIGAAISDPIRVTNADGYSGYLDPALDREIMETAPSIHPYRKFFVNYGSGNYDPTSEYGFLDRANPSGFMVCKQGSLMDQKPYYVAFEPGESLNFLFVVQASWGVSAETRADRLTPVYHCPQFNKKAASYVGVEILDNNLIEDDTDSSADLRIKVLDINHDATVGTGLGQMRQLSKVETIKIEIPGIATSVIQLSTPTPDGGNPRDTNNPMYYDVELKNQLGAAQGHYVGLVEVIDSYSPALNEHELLVGYDGLERVPYPDNPASRPFAIDKFSTYQVFEIEVGELPFTNQPPVAVFHTIPDSTCGFIPRDVLVTIDASDSYDPDAPNPLAGPCGEVVEYQFHFEWDGNPVNFDPDVTQSEPIATHTFTVSGPTVIGVRVADGCTPPAYSDITALNVTIGDPERFRSTQTEVSFAMEYPNYYPHQQIVNTSPLVVSGNNVYVAWTATFAGVEYVYTARSNDGGCTWGPPEKIYTKREECPLDTLVYVALDKLANGDPIACVISPASPPCNFQAYFFHGINVGENQVEWGHADAATLFGANSSFIDIVGHPTDSDLAYLVQWRTDITPPKLMVTRIKGILTQPDPHFPNILVDLGTANIIEDIDLAIDRNSKLHIVYDTITQVKYISVDPTPYPPDPPIVTPSVVVSRPGDVDPRNGRIEVNRDGIPHIVYSAQNGSNHDIYLQVGVGDPITFPNPSIRVNDSTTGDQRNPDIRRNTITDDWWIVYQSDNSQAGGYQILFDRFDSGLNRITPTHNNVNFDDPFGSHDDLKPNIYFNPDENSMNVVWYEGPDSPMEPNISFNRTN